MTTAPERFEDRLLTELRQVVATRPAPVARLRPTHTRRYALSGVGVAVATVAIAVVAISSDATPSAYAVQSKADGSVTVSITRLSDAAGLEQKLNEAGVPAVVAYDAPSARRCMTIVPGEGDGRTSATISPSPSPGVDQAAGSSDGPSTTSAPAAAGATTQSGVTSAGPGTPPPGARVAAVQIDGQSGAATLTIDPGQIPAGEKVFITTSTGTVDSIGMTVAAPGTASPVCTLPDPSSASGSSTAAGSDS